MPLPSRGQIWLTDFYGHVGTEIGAKIQKRASTVQSRRPAVIVSSDAYSHAKQTFTVAPLMNNKEDNDPEFRMPREFKIPWGVALDEEMIAAGWLKKPSFADCGQLYTVSLQTNLIHYCATLNDTWRLDLALQIVVGGGIRCTIHTPSNCSYGSVVVVALPRLGEIEALVVSHTLVDMRRFQLPGRAGTATRELAHCTLVPLLADVSRYDPSDEGVALISYSYQGNSSNRRQRLALCHTVYTVDRVARNIRHVGQLSEAEMQSVSEVLRDYLMLSGVDQ